MPHDAQSPQLTLQGVFRHLAEGIHQGQFQAVLFGGFALPVYGVERLTLDVDLMLRDADLPAFETAMKHCAYQRIFWSQQYARFRMATQILPDFDTVFTDPAPFASIWQEVMWQPVMDVPFPVASMRIMLATKLHALRYNTANRARKKDQPDIIDLLQANNIAPREPWFRDLCEKYGTLEIWETICQQMP